MLKNNEMNVNKEITEHMISIELKRFDFEDSVKCFIEKIQEPNNIKK